MKKIEIFFQKSFLGFLYKKRIITEGKYPPPKIILTCLDDGWRYEGRRLGKDNLYIDIRGFSVLETRYEDKSIMLTLTLTPSILGHARKMYEFMPEYHIEIVSFSRRN